MVRSTRYLGMVCGFAAAVAMAGCGGGGTTDSGTDAGGETGPDAPPMAHSYTFVVDQLTIDPTDSPTVGHTGFNLDNLYSGPTDANGCNHQDFWSMHDNDQNCMMVNMDGTCAMNPNMGCNGATSGCTGGVDNQLPTLANTIMTAASMDIRQTLTDLVNNNRLALIARVTGITDDTNSPSVNVALYVGYPTFSDNCNMVLPGRTYQISQSSIMSGATDIDHPMFTFPGSIVNGRLQVVAAMGGAFPLPLPPIMGMSISLTLHDAQLRADLGAGGASLDRGDLGGYAEGNQVRDAVCMIQPSFCSVVEGAIGGLVDIQLPPFPMMGICDMTTGSMHNYGGIGLGLGIHAVPAVIAMTNTIAASQMPGTCGASGSDGGTGGG